MGQEGTDALAGIRAHWFIEPPEGASAPDDPGTLVALARDDIAMLLAEVARLRRYLAALTPPPKTSLEGIATCCERLGRYLSDPDNVIDYWADLDQFLLPVRGSSRSGIGIEFCPWCGSKLPVLAPDSTESDDRIA
jgi:hypothetical protein